MMNQEKSALILNYLKYEETVSMTEQLLKVDALNVLIVDNQSPNESYKVLSNQFQDNERVDVIQTNDNDGYARGNNFGIKHIIEKYPGTKYVFIANNDIILNEKPEQTIDGLINELKKSSLSLAVGPSIKTMNGKNQSPIYHRSDLLKAVINFAYPLSNFVQNLMRKRDNTGDTSRKVFALHGSFFVINLSLFKEIGMFDERTFLYGEELIIGRKAFNAGYDMIYSPMFSVRHNHSMTIKSVVSLGREYRIYLESLGIYTNYINNILVRYFYRASVFWKFTIWYALKWFIGIIIK